ncbi:serine threonine protein kinase [Fusarium langsethiae]|uniref:Serine threonine protein kinase n=1 Tax=Fusarium langsethiae TaxID=179993 RepID=A0A0M9EKZ3_FUSLA|nr:serine threonine protein kinase [Fusarium langsethiae]
MHQYWKSLKWTLGAEPDAYEVVRLLCIDVGHGIQGLHEKGFSHGDLKPNNVPVFKSSERWVAKLCDFGCAIGQVTTGKEEYFGAPYWLSEASEIAALDSRSSLQQCDIYVYGLLVWSAFCLRGQHPPANPKLHNALDYLNQLCSASLRKTLVDRSRRDAEPWTWLYNERGTRQDVSSDSAAGGSNKNKSSDQVPNNFKTYKPHITLEMKARFRNRISLKCWSSGTDPGHNTVLGDTNIIEMALAVSPPISDRNGLV